MDRFFGTVFRGYLSLLFPLIVSFILLEKLHHLLFPLTQWIESHLHISRLLGVVGVLLISIALMVLIGYLCGLLIKSVFLQKKIEKYETTVLSKIPAYNLAKSVLSSQPGVGMQPHFRPALLREEESFSLCYVTSESPNYYTVYVSEGGLSGGDIQIVPKERVKLLNISLAEFTRLVRQYGIDSAPLAETKEDIVYDNK